MANIKIDLNLLKLEKAAIVNIAGKNETKECLVIPVKDNDIYVTAGKDGKKKALLFLTAWELREEGQYGDTHIVKQSFSQQFVETFGEEFIKKAPILGNGKPIAPRDTEVSSESTVQVQDDDLPF